MGDVEEMAENCLRLLTDDELYGRFSRKARELAVTNFNISKITGMYENFYHSILEQGS